MDERRSGNELQQRALDRWGKRTAERVRQFVEQSRVCRDGCVTFDDDLLVRAGRLLKKIAKRVPPRDMDEMMALWRRQKVDAVFERGVYVPEAQRRVSKLISEAEAMQSSAAVGDKSLAGAREGGKRKRGRYKVAPKLCKIKLEQYLRDNPSVSEKAAAERVGKMLHPHITGKTVVRNARIASKDFGTHRGKCPD